MSGVDVALVVLRLAVGCWLLWQVRALRLATPIGGAHLRGVTVVIPARDEERSLPRLLASLPVGTDVVVVDDGSTDGTAAQAVVGGARLVESKPLPEGWVGKSWACAQGAAVANGDVLVFVDADVRFAPGGLAAVVDELAQHGGLVSVQPTHRPVRAVEHLAMVFNIVGFAGTDAATPLGRRWGSRGAFGPVLATTRADLERAGGHEAVRDSVVEDIALAARYRSLGSPVTIFSGGEAASFRMYPEGFGQLLEGFTKNLAAGAAAVRRSTTLLVAAWLTLLVQASVAPVRAVVAGQVDDLLRAGLLYAVVAAQCWWMGRRVGRFHRWVAVTFPVSTALFLVVFVRSVWATATGRVSWRGRRIPTRPRRTPDR